MKKLLLVFSFLIFDFHCEAQSWTPLGSGLVGNGASDRVNALSGDSIHHIMWAGGSFQMAGGDSIANLAGWTGSDWIPVTIISNGDTVPKIFYRKITALIMFENKLFIAESYNSFFNDRSNIYVYDMDSLTCNAIGSFDDDVNVFHIYNNELYAGGAFANSMDSLMSVTHTTKCIAKWDGTYFQSVGVGLFGTVNALCTYNGNMLASGHIVSSFGAGTTEHGIPAWNGLQWISVVDSFGPTVDYNNIFISSLCEYNGRLFVGCRESFGEIPSDLMIWDGSNWNPSNPIYGGTYVLKIFEQKLFIGGNSIQFFPWYIITNYNDSFFSSTGKGPLDCSSNCISALNFLDGFLYAGGQFSYIGDTPFVVATYSRFVARYDPTLLPVTDTINIGICAGDIYNFNGALLDSAGEYIDTLIATSGADSIVVLNLTVTSINAAINISNDTLTATGNGTVQWYDCNNQQVITGATDNIYVATASGNYAAIITNGGCSDTTQCVSYSSVNGELSMLNELSVFPNPAEEKITVTSSAETIQSIEVLNLIGEKVFIENYFSPRKKIEINIHKLPSGFYLLRIKTSSGSSNEKFAKE